MMFRCLLFLTILLAGCRTTSQSPTAALTDEPTSRPSLLRQATVTPGLVATLTETPAPTVLMPATVTVVNTANPSLIEAAALLTPSMPQATNAADPTLPPAFTTIGYSLQGRPLTAQQFGAGSRVLLLVGGIHGGWEANTVALMWELAAHFDSVPEVIPPDVSVMIIPIANPDGYELGRTARGRFNAAGVDLNRNWSCGWSEAAYWQRTRVNPGGQAMSEPETLVLADYILRTRPAGVLFYHSAANGIFAGNCDAAPNGGTSHALAAVFGEAAGYRHDAPFTAYPITGAASNWADGEGIPAADVELPNSTSTDFESNLRGILVLLEWLAETP